MAHICIFPNCSETCTDCNEAQPNPAEGEAWYDAEIAPALAALGKRCEDRGMSFLAVVEYAPDERGATYGLSQKAGLAMQMVYICSRTAPNVDAYMINLNRHCNELGIYTGASFAIRALAEVQPGDDDGKLVEANARLIVAAPLLLSYYRATRNLQLTIGNPDATVQDERNAEQAYDAASNAAANVVGGLSAA